MQIKKQLKVELNQADVTEAIRDYLLKHNQKVSEDELSEIRYVNSAKDGIRATLNITEETDTEAEVVTKVTPVAKTVDTPVPSKPVAADTDIEDEEEEEAAPVEEYVEEEEEDIAPGEVATSTVDDVMPSIDEMAELTEEGNTAPATERKSLFK